MLSSFIINKKNMNNTRDYARDTVDERDYEYEAVFWNEELLPAICIIDDGDYQNQWLERVTRNMCVYYSNAHWSNIMNHFEWSDVRITWKALWLKALELWRLNVDNGALISDGPRTARDEWLIKGWAKVRTINSIKSSLLNQRPVAVGSNRIDWKTWYKAPYVLSGDEWNGHAILIIWFDDTYEWGCFIIKNSYWDKKYDWGKMYLPYKDLDLLFPSRYSLIDEEDELLKYKKETMENIDLELAKEGFELGLWNGLNPREPISRQEAVVVIMRAMEKLKESL